MDMPGWPAGGSIHPARLGTWVPVAKLQAWSHSWLSHANMTSATPPSPTPHPSCFTNRLRNPTYHTFMCTPPQSYTRQHGTQPHTWVNTGLAQTQRLE